MKTHDIFFHKIKQNKGRHDIVTLINELKHSDSYSSNSFNIDFKILTYGIGDNLYESDLQLLKNISCSNDGIYYRIKDITDDISYIMSSYYQMFVSLRNNNNDDQSWVVWMDYLNSLTGYRAISAALPVYDKTTNPHTLLGVVLSEVAAERLIDYHLSQWGNDVGIYDDYDSVYKDMMNSAKRCPTLDFNFEQLENIRSLLTNAETCDEYGSSNGKKENDQVLMIIIWIIVAVFIVLSVLCAYCIRRRINYKNGNINRNNYNNNNNNDTVGIMRNDSAPAG